MNWKDLYAKFQAKVYALFQFYTVQHIDFYLSFIERPDH